MSIIPIIDLSDRSGDVAIGEAIGRTCRETGFFLVTDMARTRPLSRMAGAPHEPISTVR